jgi:tetratricopeptide (TPR) repeat protein
LISAVVALALCGLLTSIGAIRAQLQTAPTPPRRAAASARKTKPRVVAAPTPATASDQEAETADPFVSGIRANNVGVALMDAHRFSEAFANFQTACIMVPDSDTGCLNSGIALIAMKQYDQARKILTTSVSRDPRSARAWFNLGLLDRAEGRADAGLADFQRVATLDPGDTDTQCLIGLGYMGTGQFKSAFAAFQAALKLDPSNAAAESGATEALSLMGNSSPQQMNPEPTPAATDSAADHTLRDDYGQQGKYSLAFEIPPPEAVAPAIPIDFVDVTRDSGLVLGPAITPAARKGAPRTRRIAAKQPSIPSIHSLADFLGSGACILDYDGDGRPDIFLVDADGNGDAGLYRNLGHDHFADVTKAAKIDFRGQGMGCAVGDYDNDGHPDLAVSFNGGVRLFHNNGNGSFADATAGSGIQVDGLAMGLSFVDYDRDGNLDLFVTRFRDSPLESPSQPFAWPTDNAPGNMMWRNNGDGTFSDVTAALGVSGTDSSSGMIADQFTASGVQDFLLTGLGTTPSLLMNATLSAFKAASWWGSETQGPTAGGLSFDFDKDGYPDVALTHWQPTTLGLWRNVSGKSFERVALPDPGWMRAWGIGSLDYDNDGWIDLVAVGETFSGEGRVVLLRNEGGQGFRDVTSDTGLDKVSLKDPRSIIAFDADGDGSLDLLITQNHRPPVLLKASGADKHNWTRVVFLGSTANRMALGVPVEMISGALRQTWEVPGASGYLSQGPALISAGLGNEGLDALRINWAPTTVEVKVSLRPDQKLLITQEDTGKRR